MVDKFMLFRLSFFPRWLYSDEHRWFTQAATKPKECVSFDGIISNGICQVWPTPRSPMAVAFKDCDWAGFGWLHLGRILGGDWDGHHDGEKNFEDFCVGVALSHYYEICTVYVTLHARVLSNFVLGRWKGILGSHLRIFSNDLKSAIQKAPSITNEKIQKASYTFHEHAVHWSKEWWHLHQEGAWLPVTVQDSLEMRAVSQGSVS